MRPADADAGAAPGPALSVLKTRPLFLAAARARRWTTPGFLLQARRRRDDEPSATPIRIGFTASKKVGKAVTRNRAKRRLRALAAELLPSLGRAGWDYVLVARAGGSVDRPFGALRADLADAIGKIHSKGPGRPQKRGDGAAGGRGP